MKENRKILRQKPIESIKDDSRINHRDRMRQRFLKNGFEGFHDYEILEYLLFFIFRQGDTKPTAKALLKRFGSFSKVLDASVEELAEVEGMGLTSALNLRAIRVAMAHYFKDSSRQVRQTITKISDLAKFARALIGDKKNEVLMAIFFNSNKEIIDSIILSEGTVTESVAFPRRIAEEALKNHSVSVVLVHNHPGGFCKPSENDLRTTREISHSLVLIGVSLLEHIIIADEDYFSFAQSGLI